MVLELAKVIFSRCTKGFTLSHRSSIIKNMLVHSEALMAHILLAFLISFLICFKGVIDALAATSPSNRTYKYIKFCSLLEACNG